MDHPKPGLRDVDADDLDHSAIDFDGLDVVSHAGEKLGDVDGFIIDVNSGRPVYVVVDAGGWFKAKFFLLPVGHVSLDAAGNRLVADLSRDRVARFPGFDRSEFEKLSESDLARMDEQILVICCPDESFDQLTLAERYDRWAHYRSPSWWDASYYRPDRADAAARSMVAGAASGSSTAMPSRDDVRAELDRTREREAVIASADPGNVSPHFGGRAQPGDVIGVETGGEQTHVGETSEDEDERRRKAEKEARGRQPEKG